MPWTWTYLDVDGAVVTDADAPSFPAQSDAETWLGESWRDLLASGVAAVSLREDDREVYGPMGLDAG